MVREFKMSGRGIGRESVCYKEKAKPERRSKSAAVAGAEDSKLTHPAQLEAKTDVCSMRPLPSSMLPSRALHGDSSHPERSC